MADRRRGGPAVKLRVLRKQQLTPHMIRIVAGGDGFAAFRPNEFTDAYVKVLFPQPGVTYPEPFDMGVIRAEYPREQWPVMRSYTVRHYDADARELAIDFVHHGDEGIAGPWARRVQPGDDLLLNGPGGAYAPGDEADWHLLAGDESALPAIALTLEAMPAGVPVRVFVEIEDASEEQPLATKGDAQVRWVHRSAGEDLVTAVRELDFPEGTVQAFVHGEAGFVRELRRYLLDERGVRKDLLSISGYWRRGATDEQWRAEKAAERAAEQGGR
ncbi:NADPH-dependent ferric siderophore reductase [Amycolatopsis bartoniae]|uniref:Siderophore-interacting protein n=1 Tax=Amycolatopsis bartoniae TaxID=941986 RepID=A0A8H9MB17_9PSEU|nr:siderophore-interacting protein [Amycolatopsis bartoniae]MBB2935733.1 NADPH-dependent ferric siderophore reductase [Amycolatopsis bartoniae]TVT05840.1 siderophore-interacting protein [Amycolatopsis bartoniae]GHF61493.1 siderophore-interacting protein [Amycolatopsis bartoniae]